MSLVSQYPSRRLCAWPPCCSCDVPSMDLTPLVTFELDRFVGFVRLLADRCMTWQMRCVSNRCGEDQLTNIRYFQAFEIPAIVVMLSYSVSRRVLLSVTAAMNMCLMFAHPPLRSRRMIVAKSLRNPDTSVRALPIPL